MPIVARRHSKRQVAATFAQREIPVEVEPIVTGESPATVEPLGKPAFCSFDSLTFDARTLGPLNLPPVDAVRARAALEPLAFNSLRTLSLLDALALNTRRALGTLQALALYPLTTFRSLDPLTLNPGGTLGPLETLPLGPLRPLCALDALAFNSSRPLCALDSLALDPLRAFGPLDPLTLDALWPLGALDALTFYPLRPFGSLDALLALGALLALSLAFLTAVAGLGSTVAFTVATLAGDRRGQSQGCNAGNQKILASHITLLAEIKSENINELDYRMSLCGT